MQKYVLLAERRSGTSLLIDCLQKHPEIFCGKRVFGIDKRIKNPDDNNHSGDYFLYRTASLKNRLVHHLDRKKSLATFLGTEFFNSGRKESIVGFRFIYNNVGAYPQVVDWSVQNSVKVIHLVRENILKTYVSTVTAKLHKMHHPHLGDKIKTATLELDCDVLIAELARRTQDLENNRVLFKGAPYLELKYEDFVQHREAQSKRLLTFLGATDTGPLESTLVKINPPNLSDIIINYHEVEKALRGGPYERYLD